MKTQEKNSGINRRKFMLAGVWVTASALLSTMSGLKVFAAPGDTAPTMGNIPDVKLNNGLAMPCLGFGTYPFRGEECAQHVADAIALGYRLFDTATVYGNEESVGEGMRRSGIDRKELFLTTKLWIDDLGYESAKNAVAVSLEKLGTDYLDLYLIHRPRKGKKESWRAMEEMYEVGKIRAIGVSNYEPHQLADLLSYAKVKPVINQIESHIYFQQPSAQKLLEKHNIQMEAWAPFAEGRNKLFSDEALEGIGEKYGKTAAQVSLRWHFQGGIVTIPRTSQKAHMAENLNIFDFKLTKTEMNRIRRQDLDKSLFPEWT